MNQYIFLIFIVIVVCGAILLSNLRGNIKGFDDNVTENINIPDPIEKVSVPLVIKAYPPRAGPLLEPVQNGILCGGIAY